jgi:hypothetical protein
MNVQAINTKTVIPAKAGIHLMASCVEVDSRFRGNDDAEENAFCISGERCRA